MKTDQNDRVTVHFTDYLGQKDILLRVRPHLQDEHLNLGLDFSRVSVVSMSAAIELADLYRQYPDRIKFINANSDIQNMMQAAIQTYQQNQNKVSKDVKIEETIL